MIVLSCSCFSPLASPFSALPVRVRLSFSLPPLLSSPRLPPSLPVSLSQTVSGTLALGLFFWGLLLLTLSLYCICRPSLLLSFSACLSVVCVCVCLSVCLSVRPSVGRSVGLSVCLSLCVSVSLSHSLSHVPLHLEAMPPALDFFRLFHSPFDLPDPLSLFRTLLF